MAKEKQDKIVSLPKTVLKNIATLAKKEGRSVKNYIERIIIDHSNSNPGK